MQPQPQLQPQHRPEKSQIYTSLHDTQKTSLNDRKRAGEAIATAMAAVTAPILVVCRKLLQDTIGTGVPAKVICL